MNGIEETETSVHPPFDPERIRQAKESLFTDGPLTVPVGQSGVRAVIERSWRRCLGEAVPTHPGSITYCEVDEQHSTLVQAARPVLERLSDHLSGMRFALFLSDGAGNILMRMAPEKRHRTQLDNASAAEGFDFSEGSVGTNGIGTVIAERRPLLVRGSEHYNDALEPLTCAGTPVFEPFSRRVLGSFALACRADDTSPLLSAIATDVGRQIESNLTTLLSADERALIRSYLLVDKADRNPVIVLNERTVFANTLGLGHVSPETHALLWTHLRDVTASPQWSQRTRIPLPSGWHDAVVEPVEGADGNHTAYCVRLLSPDPGTADRPRRTTTSEPRPGTAPGGEPVHPCQDIAEELTTAIRHGECLALDGESGTGKLHTASAVLATCSPETPPLVLDLATRGHDERHTWFDTAKDALDAGRGVVLRHLQDVASDEGHRIKALAERSRDGHDGSPARLVITVDTGNAPEHLHTLVAQLATRVRLPMLAEMPEQLPTLVTRMLAALPGTARKTTFSSEALQLLMRWSWPGNIAELRRTVEFLAHRMPGRCVSAGDLPTPMQQTTSRRRLTMMETAERDSIITALRQSDGNRLQAAAALGIGRTTLYRKMRFHRLD